jgi:hypothetical protein
MYSGRVFLRFLGVVLLLSWATSLNAQLNHGDMEGTTTDPQGAVVPGVAVTITSVETNVVQTTKTNSAGYYRVVDLVPGKYRVHFEASGFSPLDITGVEVRAGELIKVDAALTLGAAKQSVQVTAEVPLLETSASNFSTSLETHTVQNIPLAGRDLQQLVNLVPGVNNVGGPPGSNFGFNSAYGTFPDPTHVLGSDISVNGGQGGANAWYLDGSLNLSSFAENIAVNPSPDTVSEFQAITNAFAAEYSRTGGAVFNVVLKSGSNAVHGNIYEYLRNDATSARNPFTSIDATGKIIKNPLRFNNFGGTLGGPVYLPHVYNGKNRTFFFFSWDVSILHRSGSKTFTVPTPLMRQGNFIEDPNVATNGLWNPYTTVGPTNGAYQRQAFGTPVTPNGCTAFNNALGQPVIPTTASCNFSAQIPNNLQDPTAMFFMNSFPLPNYNNPLSGCPASVSGPYLICDNYLATVGSSLDGHNISLKVDHQWSEKSKYFGEWLFNPSQYRNYRVPWTGPTFPQDFVGWGSQYPVDNASQIIAIGNTYVFNPTLINELRLSFSRQYMSTHPSHPYPDSITAQSQVQQMLAPLKIPADPFFPVPNWVITAPGGGQNLQFGPTTWVNMETAAEAYTILDNVTKVMGKHTLKTGFVYRLEHTAYLSGFPTGFVFNGEQVQDPLTGVGGAGLEQFVTGAMSSFGRNSSTGVMWKPYERFRYWGFYGQDDFRISPNFTLNVGLRYDLFGLYKTRQHPNSNFCLGCPNSLTGLPGKVVYEGDPEFPMNSDIAPAAKNSIAPRLNFLWTPFADKKTIIRGGYDIFYSNAFAAINSPGQSAANAPGWNQEYDWAGSFNSNCTPVAGASQCVAFPLSDTTTNKANLTTPPLPSVFPAQQKNPLLGIGLLQFFTPPERDPMVQTWSLEVERELPGNMMIDVGYVGSHGTRLVGEAFRQFNYVHTKDVIALKQNLNNSAPISQYYSGQTAALLAQSYPAQLTVVGGVNELPLTILLKQYPFYGTLSALQNNTAFDGTSVYHGLNVKFQKRYSHGLDFIVAYTLSKKINNASVAEPSSMLVDPIHWARPGGVGGRAGQVSGLIFGGTFQDIDNKKADRAIAADDIPQILNVAATYELPFGAGRRFVNRTGIANSVIGGWHVTTNFNRSSGLPLGISGSSTGVCDQLTCRPSVVGNPQLGGSRSRAQQEAEWFNINAFGPPFGQDQSFWGAYSNTDPRAYLFGTAGPRIPQLRGPGFWNTDTSLSKEFHLSEAKYFEFRWEMLNALNHQNLALPNLNFCLPVPNGGTPDKVHQASCQFGRITNIQTDPRSMQFALKFFW